MINGVKGLFKTDENYTVDKAIVNINRPDVCSINLRAVRVLCNDRNPD